MLSAARQLSKRTGHALHQQCRTHPVMKSHNFHTKRPRGQVGQGREGGRGTNISIGCVLERKIIDYTYGAPLFATFKNKATCWFLLQDCKRRRSDVGPDGLKELYKIYKQAMMEKNIDKLHSVLTVYEYDEIQKMIAAEKKNMTAKELSNKVKAVVDIKNFSYAGIEVLEMPSAELVQLSVRFTSSIVTDSSIYGEKQEDCTEYVTFEFTQNPKNSANNIVLPIRICGSYDTNGDRIGKDSSDRTSLKSRIELMMDNQGR
eukprot:TRINITY_DN4635_c2_g1_i2.p1 TRINITY_DN4635_c2_g1~~TRINITY_DN4635_c2_g1_i2.p1  ORF type:complete len:280 (+),score=54.71 TRINITY_DN4635_c2_g1_i2:62-841(+)